MTEIQKLVNIKASFGEEFEGQGQQFINFDAKFSKEEASSQIEFIKQKSDQLDSEWCVVVGIQVEQENKQELLETLQKLLLSELNSDYPKYYRKFQQKMLQSKTLIPKVCEGSDGKIYVSLKPSNGFEEEIQSQWEKYYQEYKVEQLVSQKVIEITGNLSSEKSANDIEKDLDNKERIVASLTESAKLEFSALADKESLEQILKLLKETLKNQNNGYQQNLQVISSIGSLALSLSHFDIDLKFDSAKDIKQELRDVFMGEKMSEMYQKTGILPNDSILNSVLKTFEAPVDIYFTIPNFMAAKINSSSPQLSHLISKFIQ